MLTLIGSLDKLHKPTKMNGVQVNFADRIRLSSTLPALFALAPAKAHREKVFRTLVGSLRKTTQQSATRKEALLDFAVACFVHFLSRLDCFVTEATAAASAYPTSSKIASFFCEALLKSHSTKGVELAAVALRVCDRTRFFVDKEAPRSDAVHRASHVLRYVLEKRCPELGKDNAVLQGASRGSMPADLFALRQSVAVGQATPGRDENNEMKNGGPKMALSSTPFDEVPPQSDPYVSSEASPGKMTTPRQRTDSTKRLNSETPQSNNHTDVASVARPISADGSSRSKQQRLA